MPDSLIIRDATARDETAWLLLWQGYLDYYALPLEPEIARYTWARLMDTACPMKVRLACKGSAVLGFAIRQHHPSTWVMGDDCYLEDLFVDASARGQGVGRALIADLISLARAKGYKRLSWNTERDNSSARALYDQFAQDDGHIRYRLTL